MGHFAEALWVSPRKAGTDPPIPFPSQLDPLALHVEIGTILFRRHRSQQSLFNWQLAAEPQGMTSRTLCRQQPADTDGAVCAKTTARPKAAENLTDTEHATRPTKPLDLFWSAN